ncbi:MbcA/ParS/Xre antitoxin family protein [Salinimonas iocasae]|uniref:DUF2384 domain-containing protein n=1 Tax=Salinimonas iocasae TaxID=2572577 RepID=A0A5B7YFA3_9ALTE|nr:MbcA/ParS/Xre antitoxin family protein [Salinimonas iocasae]QCZ94374.1 DUF2384 domain-containing protein [Salinimonas iocasae]
MTISKEKLKSEIDAFFGSERELRDKWLNTPLPILVGERPLDYFSTEERRTRLHEVIGEMKFGETA